MNAAVSSLKPIRNHREPLEQLHSKKGLCTKMPVCSRRDSTHSISAVTNAEKNSTKSISRVDPEMSGLIAEMKAEIHKYSREVCANLANFQEAFNKIYKKPCGK